MLISSGWPKIFFLLGQAMCSLKLEVKHLDEISGLNLNLQKTETIPIDEYIHSDQVRKAGQRWVIVEERPILKLLHWYNYTSPFGM